MNLTLEKEKPINGLWFSLTKSTFHSVPHGEGTRLGRVIGGPTDREGAPLNAQLGLPGTPPHDGMPGKHVWDRCTGVGFSFQYNSTNF